VKDVRTQGFEDSRIRGFEEEEQEGKIRKADDDVGGKSCSCLAFKYFVRAFNMRVRTKLTGLL
jgi:hypothetical protein